MLPAGPTANLKGLKAVDVRTDDVSEDRAEDIKGLPACDGGNKPKD